MAESLARGWGWDEENSKPKRAFIGGNKNTEFRSFSVFKFHMSVPSILLQSFQNLWKNIPHLLYFVFYEMGKTPLCNNRKKRRKWTILMMIAFELNFYDYISSSLSFFAYFQNLLAQLRHKLAASLIIMWSAFSQFSLHFLYGLKSNMNGWLLAWLVRWC